MTTTKPPSPLVFFLAHVETPSFTFEALGRTKDEAVDTLMAGWYEHVQETGANPDYVLRDEVEADAHPIRFGVAYRDGEPI